MNIEEKIMKYVKYKKEQEKREDAQQFGFDF